MKVSKLIFNSTTRVNYDENNLNIRMLNVINIYNKINIDYIINFVSHLDFCILSKIYYILC
jgi:hypothetical protein